MIFTEGELAVAVDGVPFDLGLIREEASDHRYRQVVESDGLEWERMICPAADLPLVILRITLRNRRETPVVVTWSAPTTRWDMDGKRIHQSWGPDGEVSILPGMEYSIWGEIAAWAGVEKIPIAMPDEERRWGEVAH